jgi:hypothetical protein
MVGRIATGEVKDDVSPVRHNKVAGGVARSNSLSGDRKKEIAKAAAAARWS